MGRGLLCGGRSYRHQGVIAVLEINPNQVSSFVLTTSARLVSDCVDASGGDPLPYRPAVIASGVADSGDWVRCVVVLHALLRVVVAPRKPQP